MKIYSGLVANKLETHAHWKTIRDGRVTSDYKLNKTDNWSKLIKLCKKKKKKKKVRLPLVCVPIPFWNKMDEKLANSYHFSIVRDSLTNCLWNAKILNKNYRA